MGPLFSALLMLPALLLAGLLMGALARRVGRRRAWHLGAGAVAGLLGMALALSPLTQETLTAPWQIGAYAIAVVLGALLGAGLCAGMCAGMCAGLCAGLCARLFGAIAAARARRGTPTDAAR